MGRKLFVGNLPFDTTNEQLGELFSRAGSCDSVAVVTDRATGRSRGFGFVEMSNEEEAQRAQAELNGFEFQGRRLNVDAARERTPGSFGGGGRDFGINPYHQPFNDNGSRRGLRGRKRSL